MHGVSTVTRFEGCSLIEWDTTFPKVVNAGREENPPLPSILVTCELSEGETMTQLKVSLRVHGSCPAAMKIIMKVAMLFQRPTLAKSLRTVKARLES
jgi:hypothetical protein